MILSLLDPRVWLFVAAVGAAGYLKGCHDGRDAIQKEIKAQAADATAEARRLEQKRQDAADAAARLAAQREAGIRADADRARHESDGLRDDLQFANRTREESQAAAAKRASALGELLAAGAEAHRELAEKCDRHVSDLRMLLEAWPK